MKGEPLRCTVKITNAQGFHMRPLKAFVELAGKYQSAVQVSRNEKEWFDGKSPWGALGLVGAGQGDEVTLEVTGADAEQALDVLVDFLVRLPEFEEALQEPNA